MELHQAIESLTPRVELLAEVLSVLPPEGMVMEEKRRTILKRELDKVLRDLNPLKNRRRVTKLLKSTAGVDRLSGLVEDIRVTTFNYQTSSQQDIYNRGCRFMRGVDRALLKSMSHAVGAGHRSGDRQGCMKGTRRGVLQQLDDWLHEEQGERFFWLSGGAGAGKSAIAQTFAETCFADGIIGASFSCSRESDDRCNVQLILPTLTFQLAHRYPRFREELVKLLRTNPDIGQKHLSLQLDKLIVDPFEATQIQTLIIIDALDQCDDDPVGWFLIYLCQHMDGIPNVKFFVTGREAGEMAHGFFREPPLYPRAKALRLEDGHPSGEVECRVARTGHTSDRTRPGLGQGTALHSLRTAGTTIDPRRYQMPRRRSSSRRLTASTPHLQSPAVADLHPPQGSEARARSVDWVLRHRRVGLIETGGEPDICEVRQPPRQRGRWL